MTSNTIHSLTRVLALERAAILAGNYAELSVLATQKETHLGALSTLVPKRSDMRRIKASMDENQDLLAAALRGVAAAKDRIDALQSVRDGLRTYDQSGQVTNVHKGAQSLQKKA